MSGEPTQKQEATDMQKVLQIHEVTLAGKPQSFRIKSIGETHDFRRRVGELMGTLTKPLLDAYMGAEGDTDKMQAESIIRELLPLLLGDGVDGLVDMLWLYAPELKNFEGDSTDDEILNAALEVLEIAFPLVLKVGKRTVGLLMRAGISLK